LHHPALFPSTSTATIVGNSPPFINVILLKSPPLPFPINLTTLNQFKMQAVKKAIGMNPLPTRQLGQGGPNVTALGFGTMGL
jgi:hypothetical protein